MSAGPKVTIPSWLLKTPRAPWEPSGYVKHDYSDIRVRFAAIRAQQAPASTKNVATLKQRKVSK
jgi:hypothetical protein